MKKDHRESTISLSTPATNFSQTLSTLDVAIKSTSKKPSQVFRNGNIHLFEVIHLSQHSLVFSSVRCETSYESSQIRGHCGLFLFQDGDICKGSLTSFADRISGKVINFWDRICLFGGGRRVLGACLGLHVGGKFPC